MNILVFTSAMIDSHFSSYQNNAKIKPNPSNQNFFSKLIKCLAISNKVSVISHRPFVKGMFKKPALEGELNYDGDIAYYYTPAQSSKFYKVFNEVNDICKTAEEAIEEFHSKDFIIVTDTLRLNLLKAARRIATLHHVKIVGMLTDNPSNLSNTSKPYLVRITKLRESLDGYLSLTHGLVDSVRTDKPAYIFEGLVTEESCFKKDPIYDYYFFAGSLYERYGVKDLIDAFHESNIKSKLVIAGSGPLSKYIEQISLDDYRILYLTQLPKERIIGYEINAIANINPRPINKDLDNESVPSKLLEYLSVGTPIISSKYEKLYKPFIDDLFWIETNGKDGIRSALESFDKFDRETAKRKASTAKMKAFEFYGLKVQNESINHFLASINSLNN